MKHSQHEPSASSFAGISNAINLTRGMYLKKSLKQRAYRLMLGIATIALAVSLVVAALIGLLFLAFS